MGLDTELIRGIERISRRSRNIEEAIYNVEAALKSQIGEAQLLLQPEGEKLAPFSIQAVTSFLESRAFPFRGVYTASSRAGRLIVCLGGFGTPGQFFQELTNRIASELGALPGRTQEAA
ncbi:MAG TPA: hypothetical protein VGM43_10740 [Bryobacteraceae bacterium]|jgi:hypothetical protein